MSFEEWVFELIRLFKKETDIIIRESNGKAFSGFSKEADKIIDKIIFFANALASGSLKIEDVKRIGL